MNSRCRQLTGFSKKYNNNKKKLPTLAAMKKNIKRYFAVLVVEQAET